MQLSTFRRPSAWIPISMSLTALTIVLVHIARFGAAREADEGATAHLFQLLMAGQAPLLLWFMARWLPREPKQASAILAVQIVAVLAAFAPVYLLHL